MLYAFLRIFLLFVGLIAAALAAGVMLMLVETSGLMQPYDITEKEARDALFVNVIVISGYALMLGFLPGFFAGIAAEAFRWRSFLYFAVAGGLIGTYLWWKPMPQWINVVQEGEPLIRNAAKAYPAAGIIAGAMYWLITGNKTGFRRDRVSQAGDA